MLYRLAIESGLRAAEIRSLTRRSFDLDGDDPTVTVQAAYSKHRREDTVPLRPEMAARLQKHFANKHPAAPAFHMPVGEIIEPAYGWHNGNKNATELRKNWVDKGQIAAHEEDRPNTTRPRHMLDLDDAYRVWPKLEGHPELEPGPQSR
jgi:integrase